LTKASSYVYFGPVAVLTIPRCNSVQHINEVTSSAVSIGIGDNLLRFYHLGIFQAHSAWPSLRR